MLGILCLILAATAISSSAQTFTTVLSFDNTDGANPESGLVQGLDGNLYGTTPNGGADGYGTVFKMTPNGTLTVLHNFCAQAQCADGESPSARLVLATDGNFYGTTFDGGDISCAGGFGCGTVFKITSLGTLTTLHTFEMTDGAGPIAGLIQATDGNFYGTTAGGGAYDEGTVFKMTSGDTLTTLYSFHLSNPYPSALVQATDGNFYGTTQGGGTYGYGTVFKMTSGGTLTTLYSFCSQTNCTDGAIPYASLVQAIDGNFYGTTFKGGDSDASCVGVPGCGTVFKITPEGTLTTLYNFCSQTNCTDGEGPVAPLVQATDANFYGTTGYGGGSDACGFYGCGTVFKITSLATLTTLHTFDSTDGAQPNGLLQSTNGSFYGTTSEGGGVEGSGTVFSLSVGLGPFVETVPTSGRAGASVKMLGNDLTGATSVSFNGAAAVFQVISSTLISATVPAGATTGFVTVTVSGKTLKSNVRFQVRP